MTDLNSFAQSAAIEYLLTNGIGGYASSTASGANTRRYHGLLVASFNPPTNRMVMVSKIEEVVFADQNRFELSSNEYPGIIQPTGFSFIESFECDTHTAQWVFNCNDYRVSKTLHMLQGQNTTVVSYKNLSDTAIGLQLTPLLVYKDFHALFYKNDRFNFYTQALNEQYLQVYAEYGAQPLFIRFSKGTWKEERTWISNLQYQKEKDRGSDHSEDTACVGRALIGLGAKDEMQIVFSTNEITSTNKNGLHYPTATNALPTFANDLKNSSRQFVVTRESTQGNSLVAGYHWFADWGRDTMIAMRGISIATGNQPESDSILRTFLSVVNEGMLPNRFPDYPNDPIEYNTIDATLWLFVALYEYHQKFGTTELVREALPVLYDIIGWHIKGTRYNINATPEGLLYGGEQGMQLTWMDARVDGHVVTPRIGCPVEINALWYNAICIYQYLCEQTAHTIDHTLYKLQNDCRASFNQYFINDKGYLNDVVTTLGYVDDSIRPNQLYAVSLPFSPVDKAIQQRILDNVTTNLYTPFGLRTLAPDHPDFKPIYDGNLWQRDHAYHQGTIWPFLWGEWAMAFLQINDFNAEACQYIWQQSKPLQHHFYNEGCLFAIAEIFDGLQPTTGKGCIQQAWSVGNLLQVFLHCRYNWSLINVS